MKQSPIWDKLYSSNLKWKLETRNLPFILKGKKVLELGVGNGKTLKSIINQKTSQVTALDFSVEALKIIRKDFPTVKDIKSSITNMPFEDNEFDVIVCYFTLNNLIKKERKLAIKEIHRVLKNKGVLLFQDFAIGDFRENLSQKTKEIHTIKKSTGIICHFFSEKEIKILFSKFKKLKVKTQVSQPITHKKNLQRKILFAEAKK